jgi:hypothetical protein
MRKITDPIKAHTLVEDLIHFDQTRAQKRVKVSGMVSGNAPYDADTLKKTGQAHRCNVNFREGEGIIQARNTSFFELFLDGRSIIDCKLKDLPQYMGRGKYWESIVEEELKNLITSWCDFEYEMMMLANSMNLHGDAFPLFPNKDEWKFKTFKTGEVLFPKNTRASVGYIECAVVMDVLKIPDIYAKLDNPSATEMGWNKERIREVIEDSVEKNGYDTFHWEELQRDIENNALSYETVLTTEIKVAHILVREESGKISHYIMERGTQKDFIFAAEDSYDRIQEVFVPFICNIGNGYFHGIKGIGHRIYPSVVINNRFLCRAVDAAMDSASMVVAFKDGTARKGKTLRLGNQIILPPGAGLETNNLSQNLQGITSMYGLLTNVNQSSVGVKRPGLGVVAQNDVSKYTARGAGIQAIEEVELEKTDISLYYRQVDMLYMEICNRIFAGKENDTRAFQQRCIDRGVPEELMRDAMAWHFKAPRGIGSGSAVMKSLTTQDMLSIAPYLPEMGKKAVIEDFIEARGGPESIDRYYPPFEDDTMPSKSNQIANLENNDMVRGDKSIVSVDDLHVAHLETHFPLVMGKLTEVAQNPDFENLGRAVQSSGVFIEHISTHLAFLKGDRLHKNSYDKFAQQLEGLIQQAKQVEEAFGKLLKDRQKMQREQQKELQEMAQRGDATELQKKMLEIQAEQEFRVLKENHNHSVRVAKAQNSIKLAQAKALAEIEIMKAKGAAEGGQ